MAMVEMRGNTPQGATGGDFSATDAMGRRLISPTDIAQFVRLDQCGRYLRLRLHERAHGRGFFKEYNVAPASIPPLLTRSGADFEAAITRDIMAAYPTVDYSTTSRPADGNDNDMVVTCARDLPHGSVIVLFQPRLAVDLVGWRVRGDLDILRLERSDDGTLDILIVDMKSSASAKIEHRLQVAFYAEMLAALFAGAGIAYAGIELGILYRGGAAGADPSDVDAETLARKRREARRMFGADALLEIVADPESFRGAVQDLVTGADSVAEQTAAADFAAIPYHLTYKCDNCLYNEFCMKWSAAHDDLSLLPHLTPQEKSALHWGDVTTITALAALKEPSHALPEDESEEEAQPSATSALTPTPETAARCETLAVTWPVGPRLDELIHRARRYRKWKGDAIDAVSYIPHAGHGSLPYSDAAHNPNMIRIYIDAQGDYLHSRLYMLGALVVASEGGEEVPARRRSVVCVTDGPPNTPEREAALLVDWIGRTLQAIGAVAAPDADGTLSAPIHLIFYDSFDQRQLLDALARHFTDILGATPLYDFVTQLAAFDSPIATFLKDEIRARKNYPMLCQSLQGVAAYLRFDWGDYRQQFRTQLFDWWGRLDRNDPESAWYARTARFNSQIPLEYAYAAWDALDPPQPGKSDPLARYRDVTLGDLRGFHTRRLEALEWIAKTFRGNKLTQKRAFDLTGLAAFAEKAGTLADALDEFVTIERHVELGAWKNARLAPPERRVLAGITLLARYHEADQEPEIMAWNRENARKQALREEYELAWNAANPGVKVALTTEQKKEIQWSQEGMRVRLRLECGAAGCTLDEALGLTTLSVGGRVVVFAHTTTDSRLPPEERTTFTPTPRQMLYGPRGDIATLTIERDVAGKAAAGFIDVTMRATFGNARTSRGFLFNGIEQPFTDDTLYTLDSDPSDIYGFWCMKVTEALCAGGRNLLYERLAGQSPSVVWPPAAAEGQVRFLAGLAAFHQAPGPDGRPLLHGFERSKRDFIGTHGDTPTLLVQGPPGTGKSYSTAFALFARMQGALAAGVPMRAIVSCKTHAATNVLLENLIAVRHELARLRDTDPARFAAHFDARLLDLPLYRVQPRGDVLDGAIALRAAQEKGEPKIMEILTSAEWYVAAATPGGIYRAVKERWPNGSIMGHAVCDCLVLDEASQMNLPEACMAALLLRPEGRVIVVGDPRQMPPIVKHDWEGEQRRTFREFRSYESLFRALLPHGLPMIKFTESFRLHKEMASFLRREIYLQDGIDYYSRGDAVLPAFAHDDPFVAATLDPAYPLVVVVHHERGSQLRNRFEERLITPVLEALADPDTYGYEAAAGLGVVVPHRAQRAALREHIPCLSVKDPQTGTIVTSAVDTVERFQGGEREAILVSATESDRDYLLVSSDFLLDPRRLTVALSRARRKMVLVASHTVFSLFSADEETFAHAQLWKNLLRRTCTIPLWDGERDGVRVTVWGNAADSPGGDRLQSALAGAVAG